MGASVNTGPFAPGHLGELTRIVSPDLVDAALENTGGVRRRVRVLPSRVVVYLLLAGALFTEIGYQQVWARLVSGLDRASVATPGSSALSQALRRVGVAPLRELFTPVRGPAIGAARWRGLLVCAIDGTSMFVPNSAANAAALGRQTGRPEAASGYPMVRLLTVVACGTRTVIDAVFGSHGVGETTYAPTLVRCLKPGMLLLADRNFAVTALIEQVATADAEVLIRCKDTRKLPPIRRLADHSWLARMGAPCARSFTRSSTPRRALLGRSVIPDRQVTVGGREAVNAFPALVESLERYINVRPYCKSSAISPAAPPAKFLLAGRLNPS